MNKYLLAVFLLSGFLMIRCNEGSKKSVPDAADKSSVNTADSLSAAQNEEKSLKEVDQLPELIISEGSQIVLPARTHRFSKILIAKNAVLYIQENSTDWCILHCTGDVTIHGTIVYKNFAGGLGQVSAVSPSGRVLQHTILESKCGRGGTGAKAVSGQSPAPGDGSDGTNEFGGGGGGGCGYSYNGSSVRMYPGNNSSGQKGGNAPTGGSGRGGDGAIKGNINGGLIYIYCQGNFDGTDGAIDVAGDRGSNGMNGVGGGGSHGRAGGGGGGGGSAGGSGGCITLEIIGNASSYPQTKVSPGNGGAGGQGGRSGNVPNRAEDGQPGRIGFSGKIEIIPRTK